MSTSQHAHPPNQSLPHAAVPGRLRRSRMAGFSLGLLLVCLALSSSRPLAAQITSTIQGYVSDPGGASIPSATITATNEETGVARTLASSEDGYYRIPDLLAGTYQVRVEATASRRSPGTASK